jgi:hypothetical protein
LKLFLHCHIVKKDVVLRANAKLVAYSGLKVGNF